MHIGDLPTYNIISLCKRAIYLLLSGLLLPQVTKEIQQFLNEHDYDAKRVQELNATEMALEAQDTKTYYNHGSSLLLPSDITLQTLQNFIATTSSTPITMLVLFSNHFLFIRQSPLIFFSQPCINPSNPSNHLTLTFHNLLKTRLEPTPGMSSS